MARPRALRHWFGGGGLGERRRGLRFCVVCLRLRSCNLGLCWGEHCRGRPRLGLRESRRAQAASVGLRELPRWVQPKHLSSARTPGLPRRRLARAAPWVPARRPRRARPTRPAVRARAPGSQPRRPGQTTAARGSGLARLRCFVGRGGPGLLRGSGLGLRLEPSSGSDWANQDCSSGSRLQASGSELRPPRPGRTRTALLAPPPQPARARKPVGPARTGRTSWQRAQWRPPNARSPGPRRAWRTRPAQWAPAPQPARAPKPFRPARTGRTRWQRAPGGRPRLGLGLGLLGRRTRTAQRAGSGSGSGSGSAAPRGLRLQISAGATQDSSAGAADSSAGASSTRAGMPGSPPMARTAPGASSSSAAAVAPDATTGTGSSSDVTIGMAAQRGASSSGSSRALFGLDGPAAAADSDGRDGSRQQVPAPQSPRSSSRPTPTVNVCEVVAQSCRDHRDPELVVEVIVEDRPEDDHGVGIRSRADHLRGPLDFAHRHPGRPGDVQQDRSRAREVVVEQGIGDGRLGRRHGPVRTHRRADARRRHPAVLHDRADVGEVEVDETGHRHDVDDCARTVPASTSFTTVNASSIEVSSPTRSTTRSFSMTSSVSTFALSSAPRPRRRSSADQPLRIQMASSRRRP